MEKSLLATHALCGIYELTQLEFEVSRFFEAPIIAEVAQHLEQVMQATETRRPSSAIVPMPREDGTAPASFAQERLLKLSQALPGLPYFNVVYALRVTSPIDAKVLERSINEIVRRHEVLRTTFAGVNGEDRQVIAPQLNVPLKFTDLQKLPMSSRETIAYKLVQKELLHSFDLARGPLVRTRLVRLAERTHLLLITTHGIVEDGWSLGVFMNELTTLYDAFGAGRASPLTPLPIQYADFAYWQRRWRSSPDIIGQLTYWREQLHHPLPLMKLAKGRPKQELDDFGMARRKVAFPAELSEAVKCFSQREGVTSFMTLLAAFKTLLHRYLDEADLRVATHLANRNCPRTEGLIGPLVNTVILRTDLSGDPSSREVMRRVRATTLAAFANQDVPFEEVAAALKHERGVEPAALAQVMVWLQNEGLRPIMHRGHGFTYEEVAPGMMLPLVTITTFDVMLMLRDSSEGIVGTCAYKPHLFGAKEIDRMLIDFEQVVEHTIMRPDRPISAIHVSGKRKRSKR